MKKPEEIKIGEYTLKEIIERHRHWLNEDTEGWEDMRADLSGADLSDVDLSGANLSIADLSNAYLSNADLSGADLNSTSLRGANLRCADLRDVNLIYADLYGAKLRCANLGNANLRCANLRCANLKCAKLWGVDLKCADLRCANLKRANLGCANLSGANLSGANLRGTDLRAADLYSTKGNLVEFRKGKILTTPMTAYKKCKDDVIVTLEIPRGAIVFSINGNKCRTNKAKVINIDGADRAYSTHEHMSYYVGDEITIYNFNCEYNVECAEGIHFFMTQEEAKDYI